MNELDFLFEDNIPESTPIAPKMTKDEFIEKAKMVLREINEGYSRHWKDRFVEGDESEDSQCLRCHGFTQIIEGGEVVDCTSCKGTGLNSERVFDSDGFIEFIEHEVIFGELPFLELMECEIIEPNHSPAKATNNNSK